MIETSSFSQLKLYGLNKYLLNLIELYKVNKLPNKFLLSGPDGIGKCTLAYHLINFIYSDDEEHSYNLSNFEINPYNKSYKLIQNSSHPNFTLIDILKDKKKIDIDQVRKMLKSLNQSSFNEKPRFVLINNVDSMNLNSLTALLKILEEPNNNLYFILINNNKNMLKTIYSRCLNFKMNLSFEESVNVINQLLDGNIFDYINPGLINHYYTPGEFYKLLSFSKKNDILLKDTSIKNFLSTLIKKNLYKNDGFVKKLIFNLIENFFVKEVVKTNAKKTHINNYYTFIEKINYCKKFNLDEETLFIEFKTRILNG